MQTDKKGAAPRSMLRRKLMIGAAALALGLAAAPKLGLAQTPPTSEVNTTDLAVTDDTVKVGILHSVTGTMAISETGSVEAEKLAIDQINEMGGVAGVMGVMADGSLVSLYQLNLARFTAPDKLQAGTGNVYSATLQSGTVEYGLPSTNGFGDIVSNAVETSNVDLASELTSMIESQRSYSANSKVFQTGSEILDVLINLKR